MCPVASAPGRWSEPNRILAELPICSITYVKAEESQAVLGPKTLAENGLQPFGVALVGSHWGFRHGREYTEAIGGTAGTDLGIKGPKKRVSNFVLVILF